MDDTEEVIYSDGEPFEGYHIQTIHGTRTILYMKKIIRQKLDGFERNNNTH